MLGNLQSTREKDKTSSQLQMNETQKEDTATHQKKTRSSECQSPGQLILACGAHTVGLKIVA